MQVSEIRIERTKNLGNYENQKLGLTIIVDETETAVDAIEKAKLLLEWQLNKEERERRAEEYSEQLRAGGLNPDRRRQLERWMDRHSRHRRELISRGILPRPSPEQSEAVSSFVDRMHDGSLDWKTATEVTAEGEQKKEEEDEPRSDGGY